MSELTNMLWREKYRGQFISKQKLKEQIREEFKLMQARSIRLKQPYLSLDERVQQEIQRMAPTEVKVNITLEREYDAGETIFFCMVDNREGKILLNSTMKIDTEIQITMHNHLDKNDCTWICVPISYCVPNTNHGCNESTISKEIVPFLH